MPLRAVVRGAARALVLASSRLVPTAAPALGAVTAIGVVLAITATSPDARAKSAYESTYGYDRTWTAGLRLVRVDLALKVTEKDETNGYLLFDYKSSEGGSKAVPGSMEFIRSKDGSVKVLVQIPQMPRYHEQVLVDHLTRKLRAEYGDPPARRKQDPSGQPPPSDAGADGEP
ncbi:MAG: hypothetical protein KC657_28595 [Myxococcales bacterium]|nr:hypothetical protein [Myxococcales bacterium]